MQANDILSTGRFGAYFKKHLIDNFRFYGMSLIVLAGVMLLLLITFFLTDGNVRRYSDLVPFYLIGLFLAGGIFTSMSFAELGSKPRGIDFLLFPASHLEKFLSTLLVTTVGFLLLYHAAFYLAAVMGDAISFARYGKHISNDLVEYTARNKWWYGYYFWFVMQAIFLLGAIYSQKYSFIKTMFFFMLFIGGLYLLNSVFAFIFFGNHMSKWNEHAPFIGVSIVPGKMDGTRDFMPHRFLVLPQKYIDILLFTGKYLVAPCLWVIAYFRLRDKEM